MTDAEFLTLAQEFVSKETAEKLRLIARPALLAFDGKPSEVPEIPLTYLGGVPDPYPIDNWPVFERKPMLFLGQVDLGSVPQGVLIEFPPAGVLQFYIVDIAKFDFYVDTVAGSGAVRFHPGKQLPQAKAFDPPHPPLPKISYRLKRHLTLPAHIAREGRGGSNPMLPRELGHFRLTEKEFEGFLKFRGSLCGGMQLGGYACEIQDDIEGYLPQYERGVPPSKEDWKLASQDDEVRRGCEDWRLLCAYDEFLGGNVVFGSNYFWIHRDRLARVDFSRILLVTQND